MHWTLRTLVLGLGFMAISAVGPLYDYFMPLYYGKYIANFALIGALMGIDNVLALTVQPYFGALSDQTRTRFGRRIPYLLAGFPSSALFLLLVPFVAGSGLGLLVAVTILLNLSLAMYRSPTIALMPDLIPSERRSQANGIINFMGGIGATFTLVGGSMLARIGGEPLPFVTVTILLIVVVVIFFFWIREPAAAGTQVDETPRNLLDAAARLVSIRDGRVWTMIGAIFFWTMGFQAGMSWFSTYAVNELGMASSSGMLVLGSFSGTFLVMAIPIGFLSGRIGRRRVMAAGATLLAVSLGSLNFAPGMAHLLASLVVGGLGWACIIVNAYPAMVELAPAGQTGTYTGIYYIASQLAAIVAPAAFGSVIRALGWPGMWVGLLVVFGVAAFIVARARGIEPQGAAPRAAA